MEAIKRITITDNDSGTLYFVTLQLDDGDYCVSIDSGDYTASPSFWEMEGALWTGDADGMLYPSEQATGAINEAVEKLEAMIPSLNNPTP